MYHAKPEQVCPLCGPPPTFRSPVMSPPNDPRRTVGATVYTRAKLVMNTSECRRIFSARYKTKEVTGTVISVQVLKKSKRSVTNIEADWSVAGSIRRKCVNLASVKATSSDTGTSSEVAEPETAQKAPPDPQVLPTPASPQTVTRPSELPVTPSTSLNNENARTRTPTATSHGRDWFVGDVTAPLNGPVTEIPWSVRGPLHQVISDGHAPQGMKPIDFFLYMFPPSHLQKIAEATSARLVRKAHKPTTVAEILRFFGVLVLMTRTEFSDRRSLWGGKGHNSRVQQVDLSPDISRHRFEEIAAHISYSGIVNPAAEDRWSEVEGFVEAINRHRRIAVTPSETICVDESISRWYGLGGDWSEIGLPHYVKLDRKPESGCELKTACCGTSGIMLAIELTKSAIETRDRDYEADMQHGTATILRLLDPWLNTNRHVCADSFFASVSTAVKLWDVGLRFTGVIKTATRLFPMSHLSSLEMQIKGDQNSLTSGDPSQKPSLMAVCWVDRDRRYFISSTGTTKPGTPIYRERYRTLGGSAVKIGIEIPIPEVCEKYYSVCSMIDRHNRCRQHDLDLEKKFRTHSWAIRVNTSLLAMVIVDGWLLYKNSRGLAAALKPWNFYSELATGLLDNTYDTVSLRSQAGEKPEETPKIVTGTGIHLVPTDRKRKRRDGTTTGHQYQGRCAVCQGTNKSADYCSECHRASGREVFLCHPRTKRQCFGDHLFSVHDRT